MTIDKRKRSLYQLDWQLLRVSLDFSTLASTHESLGRIDLYAAIKDYNRISAYKIINLCAATVMGLTGQLADADSPRKADLQARITSIQTYRKRFTDRYYVGTGALSDFDIDNEYRIKEIAQASTDALLLVYRDLRRRWISAHKRTYTVRRDELGEYLGMLESELNSRGIVYKKR